ncbi:MAG: two-component sensor histidine kinase [Phycisphaeraceae bacterium]|nr:two-component sensor histidine kinase [Phycisphaeraceae bacterium]
MSGRALPTTWGGPVLIIIYLLYIIFYKIYVLFVESSSGGQVHRLRHPISSHGGTMPASTPSTHPDELARVEQLLEHFEQLEAQFEMVRESLTHSHRLATLGTIATIIAHEYNNILTPIVSYAQLALADPDDHATVRKALEKSLSGAERAAKISASLLGFAREADEHHVARLCGVIDEAIGCMARDPAKDGLEVEVDVPDALAAISPLNLQQVLLNLLLNAKNAMRRGGGRITVSARVEGGMIHLDVADTGPGIAPEIIDRLFEPFVTHRSDPAADRKGTGLGLCICRDLVRAAGGSISVESKPGQGATFHIRLPVADELFETT